MFPLNLHSKFTNSMAEQTPEQSVYGIPDFAFNSNGWGPCSIPEQFEDLPFKSFSRDDKLGMIIDVSMLNGVQRLQNSKGAFLWHVYAQVLNRMTATSSKWTRCTRLCRTRTNVLFVVSV